MFSNAASLFHHFVNITSIFGVHRNKINAGKQVANVDGVLGGFNALNQTAIGVENVYVLGGFRIPS